MNAMTNAMRTAGMKTPTVMYRIWNWLKDHPEKTAEDITKALGSTYPLNTQITDMYRRGMLTVYKDKSPHNNGLGFRNTVFRYSVVNVREYVLLPTPKKKTVVDIGRASTVQALVPQQVEPKKAKVELTEAEEFAAYLEFKALKKAMKK